MMRMFGRVMSVVVGVSVIVGGCSGSGAGASPSASHSASVVASVVATPTAVPTATPTPIDPDTLFNLGIAEGPAWRSFHLNIAVGGTIKAAVLRASGDPAFAKVSSDAVLDGTTVSGDVDAPNLAFHLGMTVPAIPALHSGAISADLIIKNSTLYVKTSALGAKYRSVKLGTISKSLGVPVSVPTPGASALTGLANVVADLRANLETNGVAPKLVGIDQVGGRAAYHIDLTVPLDQMNKDIAAAAASAGAPGAFLTKIQVTSMTAGVWIYQDNYELAQVQLAGSSSDGGNLSFTMTLTSFDQPVTINAPATSDVASGL
jgi:hypothetical protein